MHTGKQSSENAAFNFAKSLSEEAAYQSISMRRGQIMEATMPYVDTAQPKKCWKTITSMTITPSADTNLEKEYRENGAMYK